MIVWLTVVAVYAPALAGGYVDDDLDLLAISPTFGGPGRLWEAVWSPFWGEDLGYWRPLTSAVMSLGHWAGGGHPWPTHLVALLCHLCATTLAFRILRRFGIAQVPAALAAAVFALHPVQVESVAWVAALGDPLAGVFVLLAVDAWLAWRQNGAASVPGLAWLGVGLGLASKESGVAAFGWLIAVEIACRALPCGAAPSGTAGGPTARRRRTAFAWAGVGAVAALWLAGRVLVFGDLGAGFGRGTLDLGVHGLHAVVLRVYLGLGLLAVPTGWLGFTPYRWVPPDLTGLLAGAAPSLILVLLLGWALVATRRRHAALARFAVVGGLATLGPAVLLPQALGPWPLVDRYAYLLVFAVLSVAVAGGGCRTWLAACLAAVAAVKSASLVPLWRSHDRVVARALADCPHHPEPHFMLGNLELQRGDRSPAQQRPAARRAHYRRAVAAYGATRIRLQRPLYAGAHLRAVLGLNARLGAAMAAMAGRLRDLDAIRSELSELAAERPDSAQVLLALGAAHAEAGDAARAEAAWLQALTRPGLAHQAAFNLGRLYLRLGRLDEAREMLARVLDLDPNHVEAARLLASIGH